MSNNYKPFSYILALLCIGLQSIQSQETYKNHWEIASKTSILWDLNQKQNLPHTDNIEMAGTKVAGIISYAIDSLGNLSLERQVFFPQLHPFIKETDPDWFVYRAYLKDTYTDVILPKFFVGNKEFNPGAVVSIQINGMLEFVHENSTSGLSLRRTLYPSMDERLFIEQWTFTNTTNEPIPVQVANVQRSDENFGKDGKFYREISSCFDQSHVIPPKGSFSGIIKMMARKEGEKFPDCDMLKPLLSRKEFLTQIGNSLNLETPEPVLNTLFEFSKIRASESIFESKLGLIHSPGGGRYYVGTWANDQAEYVSPFFPFLGYDIGTISAMNTYRAFAKKMNSAYTALPYAYEVEELEPPANLDRGDAAMIAYGASQFALALGDAEKATELWPLIQWCLEYNHKNLNREGVVQSDSDEMEGRIETGSANLSTASLYYGALEHSISLAKALGKPSKLYRKRLDKLELAIENYFGAKVEGLDTYKYYKEHTTLRHWICLPLVMGIDARKDGTIEALFDRLWTENGVHVEKNNPDPRVSEVFWDRGTLYALRGTFIAGATEVSMEKLLQFSKERLVGKRVPYVVEAFPEGNMAHLSAESGLYCRVFTEGLFGIKATGFTSFTLNPRLPKNWNKMALRNIKAFGKNFDIEVYAKNNKTNVKVIDLKTETIILEKSLPKNIPLSIRF